MKIFFAGIIQGSYPGSEYFAQDYRVRVREIISRDNSAFQIYDPVEVHADFVDYDDEAVRLTFFKHLDIIASCDLLLAYLPEASMGTAIEMWHAWHNNVPVISISPMAANWVIRLFSQRNFHGIEEFERFVTADGLSEFVRHAKQVQHRRTD